MKPALVITAFLAATPAFGDLILKQKQTTEGVTRDVTQYISTDRMRVDTKSKEGLTVAIIDKEKMIICTKPAVEKSKKGTCSLTRISDLQHLGKGLEGVPGLKMEFQDYELTDLRKKGNYAGRSCDMIERKMTLKTQMANIQQTQNVTERFCSDRSVKVSLDGLTQKFATGFNLTTSDKGMWKKVMAQEKAALGATLYSSSTTLMTASVSGPSKALFAKGLPGIDPDKPSTVTVETVSVKETKLQSGIFEVPARQFELPPETRPGKAGTALKKKRTKKKIGH